MDQHEFKNWQLRVTSLRNSSGKWQSQRSQNRRHFRIRWDYPSTADPCISSVIHQCREPRSCRGNHESFFSTSFLPSLFPLAVFLVVFVFGCTTLHVRSQPPIQGCVEVQGLNHWIVREIPTFLWLCCLKLNTQDFPGGLVIKNPPATARDMDLIPGPGRFPHAWERLSPCCHNHQSLCPGARAPQEKPPQ